MTLTRHPRDLVAADHRRFDPLVTLTLAELADLSYRPGHVISPALIEHGWEAGWLVSEGNAQAVIAWAPEAIVVVARGSDLGSDAQHWSRRILDWRHNARSMFRRSWRPYIPHGIGVGWRAQAQALLDGVLRGVTLARQRYPWAPVYLVGHSAGGPIACYLAVAIRSAHGHPRLVVTLSSPRPGGEEFSRWYDRHYPQTWRVVPIGRANQQDLITRLPWSGWPVSAWHVGQPKILTPWIDGTARVYETEADWDEVRGDREVGLFESVRAGAAAVRAHYLDYAVELLRGMVGDA